MYKRQALNSAVWSGGTFIYVPKGVKVDIPLQTYFRINNENTGQFERTLIIVDEGASVHYVEGCTAPTYSSNSLHAAIVEIFALDGAYMRYTTIQNWSDNVYNLVTKRARALADATVEWIDGNLGAKTTMKYPSVYLDGPGARGTMLSIASVSYTHLELKDFLIPQEKTEEFFYSVMDELDLPDNFKDSGMLSFRVTPRKDRLDVFVTKSELNKDLNLCLLYTSRCV